MRAKGNKADDELRKKCHNQGVVYTETEDLLYTDAEIDLVIADLADGDPEMFYRLENNYPLSELIRYNYINMCKNYKPDVK